MGRFRSATYGHVLSPAPIGSVALNNRIVLAAMDMNLCVDGELTDAEVEHYAERAAGGVGMVITGSGAVAYPVGATSQKQPGLSHDRFDDGLGRLARAVHGAGSRLCVQLCHHGKNARLDMAQGRPVLVPSKPQGRPDLSALVDNTGEELTRLAATTAGNVPTYHEATDDDLAWVIDQFAQAAARVRRAGADAVEIHAAHGYLLSTFLSPADNRRRDRWGGPIEHRARLSTEVTSAVRAAVGPDMGVIVRINGQEFGPGSGLSNADAATAAALLAGAGADAIHVSGYGLNSFANFTDGPLPDALGAYRAQAAAIKAAVTIPVIAVGRLTPEMADEMIAVGDCDFVSMGRQLLADPDLVAKLRAGNRRRVRPCINCYVCVEQNFFDDPPVCAVNPTVGGVQPRWQPATDPKTVVVVGGGPGGMEAARIAAERGHRVKLLEAGDRLGGTVWFSQLTTPGNQLLVDWHRSELERLGVEISLSTWADRAVVESLNPDVVIVATGARRGIPEVPGADLAHVHSGDQLRALILGEAGPDQPRALRLLAGAAKTLRVTADAGRIRAATKRWLPLGRNVVIVGGSLVGLELAEFLAERGRSVTVLEAGAQLGLPMALPRRWTAVRRASEHGVTVVRNATLTEIDRSNVHYQIDGESLSVAASDVIIASEVTAAPELAESLADLAAAVHVVGDASSVGYIQGAVHSAWSIASVI